MGPPRGGCDTRNWGGPSQGPINRLPTTLQVFGIGRIRVGMKRASEKDGSEIRDEFSGTKFSFPGIGNSREISTIHGKFPGKAKNTKILRISRGWTMIYAFNWTNMKKTDDH